MTEQTDAAEVVRYCPACGHELHTLAPFCRCGCTYDGTATTDRMRAGMHDQPAIYPTLPSRQPDPDDWALMVKPSEGTIWQTCWEYVLSHTLTDAEGAAFWTGANLIAKQLAAREAAARAEERERVAAAILMACCHFDRYKGKPESCGYCDDALRIARTDGAGS